MKRNNCLELGKSEAARATLRMNADMFVHCVVLQTDEDEKRGNTLSADANSGRDLWKKNNHRNAWPGSPDELKEKSTQPYYGHSLLQNVT